jgi:hypothetical protein
MTRKKLTKKQFLDITKRGSIKKRNPYDLGQLGMGFNQPCPKCGLEIDRRASPYEPVGFKNYCRCK